MMEHIKRRNVDYIVKSDLEVLHNESTFDNKKIWNTVIKRKYLDTYQNTKSIRGTAGELNMGTTAIKRYMDTCNIGLGL